MAVAGWKPTAANYLGRVSKARILEAVTETKGASAAELIEHMRKSDMAEQAERLLMDTGWLPEPLRTSGAASLAVTETPQKNVAASGDDLPAFLAEAA
jgi:ParB family chromosome partitioning protein